MTREKLFDHKQKFNQMKRKEVLIFVLLFVFFISHGFAIEIYTLNQSDDDSLKNKEQISEYPSSLTLDFDSITDFTLDFTPWSVYDIGGGNTYPITGINFLHSGEPMAFICFNPDSTTPPEQYMKAHTGTKLGCVFSSIPPHNPNNKWLISPKMSLAASPKIEFWVQTYNTLYGLEKFNVGVSITDSNPTHFELVNTEVESAPSEWTRKTYLLEKYANQDVFVGIQCVSNDQFIFMIDDISITSIVGINDQHEPDGFSIYPNPVTDNFSITFDQIYNERIILHLFNPLGEPVRKMIVKPGNEPVTFNVHGLPGGIYYLQIRKGKDDFIRKISIIDASY